MKQYIITILSLLTLFASCSNEELDNFAIDDINISLALTWEGHYPHFEVKVNNECNRKISKVMLRLLYHDQVKTEINERNFKDIELTGTGGIYSYTAKDFEHSFAGDSYKAYAYIYEEGCFIRSEIISMTVPGNKAPEMTSGAFVFNEDGTYFGEGDIHLYGSNFSHHLRIIEPKQYYDYVQFSNSTSYEFLPNEIIIHNCRISRYGENSVSLYQNGITTECTFDVPGLKIESVSRRRALIGETVIMKVSGMKPECEYRVLAATTVSVEDGIVKFIPDCDWEDHKVILVEKHFRQNSWNLNNMYCYYDKTLTVIPIP